MSFLQGFEHDCFISYRHLDDVGLDGMQVLDNRLQSSLTRSSTAAQSSLPHCVKSFALRPFWCRSSRLGI
ncbi:MAG: hypothetical protein WBA40_04985 [Roseiarcus sp.]